MTKDEKLIQEVEKAMNPPCAYCGEPVGESGFMVHRDGFSEGPEVHLCTDCGSHDVPSLVDIWDRISTTTGCARHGHDWVGDQCRRCRIDKEELWGSA